MIEKVNPMHPDKIADRIAGAIVDLAYMKEENPRMAVEVLIGHEHCIIISETNAKVSFEEVEDTVHRIAGENVYVHILPNKQDEELAKNQEGKIASRIKAMIRVRDKLKEVFDVVRMLVFCYNY